MRRRRRTLKPATRRRGTEMLSLKAFHLFFIAMSVILAAFVAAWATGEYKTAGNIGYVATAVGSGAAGIGLIVYGAKFQRKVRHL